MNKILKNFFKLIWLTLILTSYDVLSQDLSISLNLVGESKLCSENSIPSIDITLSSNFQIDLRGEKLEFSISGATTLAPFEMTIPNQVKFNLATNTTEVLRIDDDTTENFPSVLLQEGVSNLTVSFTVVGDIDLSNNSASVSVTYIEPNTPIITSEPTGFIFCENETVIFNAGGGNGTDTYYWRFGDNNLIQGESVTKAAGELSNGETIKLYLVTSEGCSSTIVTQDIVIDEMPEIVLNIDPVDNTICKGQDIEVTVQHSNYITGNSKFKLTGGDVNLEQIFSGNQRVFNVTNIQAQTLYTVIIENSNGCSASSTFTIKVPLIDEVGIIASNFSGVLCYGDNLNETIYGDGSNESVVATLAENSSTGSSIFYEWQWKRPNSDNIWSLFPGSGNTQNLDSSIIRNQTLTEDIVIRRLVYAVNGTDKCLVDETYNELYFVVNKANLPEITEINNDYTICNSGDSITLQANNGSFGDEYHWYKDGTFVFSSTSNFYTIESSDISKDTVFGLKIITDEGCESEIVTKTINLNNPIEFTLYTNQPGNIICEAEAFTLTVSLTNQLSGLYNYTFDTGGQTSSANNLTGVHTFNLSNGFQGETTFSVIVEDSQGCTAEKSITVYIPRIGNGGSISTSHSGIICSEGEIDQPIVGDGSLVGSSSATLSLNSSTASIVYVWQLKGDSDLNWRTVAGSSNTINLSENILRTLNFVERTRIRRLAYSKIGSVQCLRSDINFPEVIFEIETPRNLTLTTSDNTICENQNITYNASGLLSGDIFEWRLNGVTKATGTANGSSISYIVVGSESSIGVNTIELFVSPPTVVCSSTTSSNFQKSQSRNLSLETNKDFDTVCVGENIIITATLDQIDTGKYYFKVNSVEFPPQSSNAIEISSSDLTSPQNNIEGYFISDTSSCTSNIEPLTIQKIIPLGGQITTALTTYCVNDIPSPLTNLVNGNSDNGNSNNYYFWESSPDLNFETDVTKINSNSSSYTFLSGINRTTYFRRVFVGNIGGTGTPPEGGKDCLEYSNIIELQVFSSDGGSIDHDLTTPGFQDFLYECDIKNNNPTVDLFVIDNNPQGNYSYQWQYSTDEINWINAPITPTVGNTSQTYTLTATKTTGFYRRLTTDNTGNCGTATSTVLTYISNVLDPGVLNQNFTGPYCWGADPPELGINSAVAIPQGLTGILYQWQRAESNNLSQNVSFTDIIGATSQNYDPPNLDSNFRHILYRRGVRIDDGALQGCWRYTSPVVFTQIQNHNWGDIILNNPNVSDFRPFCEGQDFPTLQLNIIDPVATRFLNNGNNGVTFNWQRSFDLVTWTTVTDPDNRDELFNPINDLDDDFNDPYYLSADREMYFRVQILFNNNNPINPNFVNNNHESGQQIRLVHRDANEILDLGEIINVRIGGSQTISITIDSNNNSTDQLGILLADQISIQDNGYQANYYPESDFISLSTSGAFQEIYVFNYDNPSNQIKFNKSIDFFVTQQTNTQNQCDFYTSVFHLDVDPIPTIDFGSSSSQIKCAGDNFDPLLVTWSGTGTLTISGLDPNLTVSSLGLGGVSSTVNGDILVTGTNSLTITGPANLTNNSNTVNFRLNADCGNIQGPLTTINYPYIFNVIGPAPQISGLFRDNLYEDGGRYRQVINQFSDINNPATNIVDLNNTVVLDPTENEDQTIDLYACFDENATGFKNLEWFISISTAELNYTNPSEVPATVLQTLYDTEGESNEEEGVRLLLNPLFFSDNNLTEGALVDIGVRSTQTCDGAKSSVSTFTFYFINAENNDVNDLSRLFSPEPINVNFCGFDTNPVPTCEILTGYYSDNFSTSSSTILNDIIRTEGKKYYTQFFTSSSNSVNGSNDFAALNWQIKANDEAWGSAGSAGSISEDGYVLWNDGFFGTVQIRVAPISARSSSSSATIDETKYSYSSIYTIGEVDETIPEIIIEDPLVCPTPNPLQFIKEIKSFGIDLNYTFLELGSDYTYNTNNLGTGEGISITYNGSTLNVREGENGNITPQDLVNELNNNNYFGSALSISSSRDAFNSLKIDISLTESSTTNTVTVNGNGNLKWDFGSLTGTILIENGDQEQIIAQKLASAIDLQTLNGRQYRAISQGSIITITESVNSNINAGTAIGVIPSFTATNTGILNPVNFETNSFLIFSHTQQGILIKITNNSNSVSLSDAGFSISSINRSNSFNTEPIELVSNFNQTSNSSIDTEFISSSYPNQGVVTSRFYIKNGADVDWYILRDGINDQLILDNIGLGASIIQYNNTQFFKVNGNSGELNKDLTITWAANAGPGTFSIKAVPRGCSGTRSEWVRDLTYTIPNQPNLNFIADPGVNPSAIKICEGDTEFQTIRYEIRSRLYDNIRITEPIDPSSTLPNNFITRIEHQTQSVTIRFQNNSEDNFPKTYIVRINNTDFSYEVPINQAPETTAQAFANLIKNDPNFSSTQYGGNGNFPDADGFDVVIIPKLGVYIENINFHATGNTTVGLKFALQQVYPILEITGISSSFDPGNYNFFIDLNLGDDSYCIQQGGQNINIEVWKDVSLVLDQTKGETDQTICFNSDIDSIVFDVFGKDPNESLNVTLSGNFPSSITSSKTNWNNTNPQFKILPSGQKTNYWNTRNFNFKVISQNDNCQDIEQDINLTIYPEDFLRTSTVTPSVSQQLCEGQAIDPIYYEFWGTNLISATIEDTNDLNLNYSISNRTQIASITFRNIWPTTTQQTNRDETYNIYIDDRLYSLRINPSPNNANNVRTPLQILTDLATLIRNDNNSAATATVSQTDLDGDGILDYAEIIFTARVAGVTFSIDTTTINATYVFADPHMITAPKLITITGTPTVNITNNTDVQSYTFNIITIGSNYCDNSKPSASKKYTLNIEAQPSVEVTSDFKDITVCDGFTNDFLELTIYRGSGFQISTTSTNSLIPFYPGLGSTVTPVTINSTNYRLFPNVKTNVETITTFTYTVTPTGNQCGENSTNSVTGTITIIPHYIEHIQFSGSLSQTVCESSDLIPINFKWSGDYSKYKILWEGGLNPGLNLSSTSNTLTLSGTIQVPETISSTASYSYRIEIDGDYYSGDNCNTLVVTGTITVLPESRITLKTPTETLNQVVCDENSIDITQFYIENGASNFQIIWEPNKPEGIDVLPLPQSINPGTSTITISGIINSDVVSKTTYRYTINTLNNLNGCNEDSVSGTITVYPSEDKFLLSSAGDSSICFGESVNMEYQFKGIPKLFVTSDSELPDGLTVTTTYSSKSKTEFTVSGSTSLNDETYSFSIINYNGLSSSTYSFISSSTLNSNELASGIASFISNENVSVTSEDSKIIFEAKEFDFSFLVTNTITSGSASIVLSKYAENRGLLSISGIPVDDVFTSTNFQIGIRTPGLYCDSFTITNTLTLNPKSYINLTSTPESQNLDVCDGTQIEEVSYFLKGAATNYSIQWTNGLPEGVVIEPVPGSISSSNSTLTFSGTINTGVTSRTVYPYIISTISEDGTCNDDSISGTITVYPSEDKYLLSSAGDSSICFGESVNMEYEFIGISGLSLTPNSQLPEGLNLVTTYTQSPSIKLLVSGNSTQNDIYTFKIIENDLGERTYNYLPKSVKSASQIASEISSKITDAQILISVIDGNKLLFSSKSDDYNFNLSITSSGTAIFSTEEYKPVRGTLSITGIVTDEIYSVTNYTYGISTTGINCKAHVVTSTITVNPKSYVELNSNSATANQIICDNSSLENIDYILKGGATNFEIIWPNGQPDGIIVNPPSGGFSPANTLVRISGTPKTSVVTKTVYEYQISTIGNLNNCGETILNGTITILPSMSIEVADSSSEINQEVCNGVAIKPIIIDFVGGTSGATLDWSPSDPGINWNTTSSTLTISGTVNTSGLTQTTTYTYTVTSFGNGCNPETITGDLVIIPELKLNIVSPTLLFQRSSSAICENDPIQEIVINVDGVSNYGVSGNISWTSINYLENIVVSQTDSNTFVLSGNAIPNQDITNTYTFTYDFIISSFGSCQQPKKVSGEIELISIPEINSSFIQENDVQDVLCFGEASGKISIPLSPQSELLKRISGARLSQTQIDRLNFDISDPDTNELEAGDQLGVTINDILFIYTYGIGNSDFTLEFGLNQMILQINNYKNLNVSSILRKTQDDMYIELSSEIPGLSYTVTTSIYPITSNVTVTASITNESVNFISNEQFLWFFSENDLVPFTTGNNIDGLESGIYYLEVIVSGCNSERVPISINQPLEPLGVNLNACDTSLQVEVSGGTKPYRLELYREDKTQSNTITLTNISTQIINTGSNYIFNNLLPTQAYHAEVYDANNCYVSKNIVIPLGLEIDKDKIKITNDKCTETPLNIGEGSIEIINNGPFGITGGSGQYAYMWNGVTTQGEVYYNTANITDLLPGIYNLTVEDIVLGCTTSAQFQIQAPPSLEITYTPFTTTTEEWYPELSQNSSSTIVDRLISLNCPSDTANMEVLISGAIETAQTISNTTIGAYSVDWFKNGNQLLSGTNRIIDQGPGIYKAIAYLQADPTCSISYSFEVRRPEEYSISVINVINPTCNDDRAELVVEISGGKPNSGPYQLVFNDGILIGNTSGSGERRITFSNIDPKEINELTSYKIIDNLDCLPTTRATSITFNLPEQIEENEPTVNDIDCSNNQLGSIRLNLSGFDNINDIYVRWTIQAQNPFQPGFIKYLPWDQTGNLDVNGNAITNGTITDLNIAGNYNYEVINETTQCEITSGQIVVKDLANSQIILNDIKVIQPGCSGTSGSISLDIDLSTLVGIPTITWEKYVLITNISSPSIDGTVTETTTQQWQQIEKFKNSTSAFDLEFGSYRATIQDEGQSCSLLNGRAIRTNSILIGSQNLEIINTRVTENIPIDCNIENMVTGNFEFDIKSNIQNISNNQFTYLIELTGQRNGLIYSNNSSPSILVQGVNYTYDGIKHSFSGLKSDNYNLLVTRLSDENNCSTTFNFIVNEYTPLKYTGDKEFNIDSCSGIAEITANAIGGVPFLVNGSAQYQFNWTLNVIENDLYTGEIQNFVGQTIYVDKPGKLILEIRDSNDCYIVIDNSSGDEPIQVVYEYEPLTLKPNLVDENGENVFSLPPSCQNQNESNGKISFEVLGGKEPIKIAWFAEDPINGNLSEPHIGFRKLDYDNKKSVSNLEPGNYKIVVESLDANCINVEQFVIEKIINVPSNKELYILDGPYVDEDLCRQIPGRLIIDIFDNLQGGLSFYYNDILIDPDSEVIRMNDRAFMLLITDPVENANLLIQNENGCQISTNISLGVGEPSFEYNSVNLEASGSILAREQVSFENTSTDPFIQSEWIFGDNSPSVFVPVLTDSIIPVKHEFGVSGTYFTTLRIYNEIGCSVDFVEPIIVGKGYNIMTPTVFTPNGDLVNDIFKPLFSGLSIIDFTIYDYKGNLIYHETKPEDGNPLDPNNYSGPIELKGWDGNTNVQSEYFIYSIRAKSLFGNKEILRSGTFIKIE